MNELSITSLSTKELDRAFQKWKKKQIKYMSANQTLLKLSIMELSITYVDMKELNITYLNIK